MDLANPLIMNNTAALTNLQPAVQDVIFGEQKRQANQNILDEQARGDDARKAMATLVTTPNLSDEQVNQLLIPIAAADPNAAAAYRQQQQQQADFATLLANPNPRSIGAFMMKHPSAAEGVKKAWDTMSAGQAESAFRTATDVFAYLHSGDASGAKKILQAHIDADTKAGLDTSEYAPLIELLNSDPDRAKTVAGMMIASRTGADKFAETFDKFGAGIRADEVQPYKVRQEAAQAEIKTTEAQFAPDKMQSDLATAEAQRNKWQADIADAAEGRRLGWANLGLEQDKLETTTQLKLQELSQTSGKVPDGALGVINQKITDATTSAALATRADNIAAQLKVSGAWSIGGGVNEWLKGKAGMKDGLSQLRTEVAQFNNSAALKLLPPGPASDKDVAFVKEGFPKPTDPPQYVARWFETYARLQRDVGAASERQGNWMAANGGSLGPARSDISVGGVQVRAGTKFTEFNSSGVAQEGGSALPPSIDMLAQRYGRK